jgi:hypothetical protein
VAIHNQISVVVVPSTDELPFDPADARVIEASRQLAAIAKHPVVFEFDVALLPNWRSVFQEVLVTSMENVARDLDALSREQPRAAEHGLPLLERVVSRYDAAIEARPEARLDAAARVLTVRGPATFDGVARGLTTGALEDEYTTWARARYAGVRAQDLPPGERRAYYEFLTERLFSRSSGTREQDAPRTPDAQALLGVIALSSAAGSPPDLSRDVRAWLLKQAEGLADAYNHEEDRVAALPAASSWRRAEAAWIAWARATLPTATDEERAALAAVMFVRTRGTDGVVRASRVAFPGLDLFAFGVEVADAWARAGHPGRDARSPAQRALLGATVCPVAVDADGVATDNDRCDYGWYDMALDDPAMAHRLLDVLRSRRDKDLVRSAFFAVGAVPREGDVLARLFGLLDGIDADDAVWTVAFRVVADRYAEGGDVERWIDLARRQWPSHPSRRGLLLYGLAQVDRYGNNDGVGWTRFTETFGGAITASELGALLDQGARGWSLVFVVWPALWKGPRAPVLLPRLDAYLARTDLDRYDAHDPSHALAAVARRMCEASEVGDMAELARYFRRRVASHPGETFAASFEDTADCAKRAPAARGKGSHGPLGVRSP